MSQGRELELKFRLPRRADFLKLRDGPEWGERLVPRRQVNHYFDTADGRFARSRILLRIRREPGGDVMTLKCGEEKSPGVFDSLELEQDLDATTLQAALERPDVLWELQVPPVEELRRRVGAPPLVSVGFLENERVERRVGGRRLEVDRMTFADGRELHELELETEDAGEEAAWVRREIAGRGILLVPERRTKLELFLAWKSGRLDPDAPEAGAK